MFCNALFNEEDIIRIKNTEDSALKELVEGLIKEADNFLEEEVGKFHGFGNNEVILSMGFAYHYTGDKKYLDRALALMKDIADNKQWYPEDFDPFKENVRADIATGGHCTDMAYGLAFFGDLIPEENKNHLAETLYNKGIIPILEDWIRPETRIHALDTMGHNFWIVTICSCAIAALVIKNIIPDGEKCVDECIYAIKAWFEYKGNKMTSKPVNIDNGAYYEGINYGDYSIHEYLKFAIAYKRLTGRTPFDDSDVIRKMALSHVMTAYSSDTYDYYAGFGDCSGHEFRPATLLTVAYGLGTPEIRWYVNSRNDQKKEKLTRILAWEELHGKEERPPEALSVCYNKIGWAMFRDSHEKNANAIAIKCGDTWNHAHADCAHFILFRKGKPEILDSHSASSYSRPEYIGYYVQSEAHNVLLFNGKGQDFRDNFKNHAHVPGKLLNYMDKDGFRYVVADGTGPMGRFFRKHLRHFLWIDDFILVYDDIECYECGKVSFLLHAKEDTCFRMLSDHTVEFRDGYIDHSTEKNFKYKSFNTHTDDDGHAKFVGIMVLDESLSTACEKIENGFKVTCGKTTVYINYRSDGKVMHKNSLNVMDGIFTDAIILVNDGEKFGVVNGSIVRKDGEVYLNTLSKINGWVK